jgi:hypothetical protein
MATLALSYAGGAIGNMLLPGIGGIVGKAVGALAGAYIDSKLFGTKAQAAQVDPNRFKVTTSTEGKGIPRLYGRSRIGGEIIWSTYFLRVPAKSSGGKGSMLSPSSSSSTPQDHYYANWAIALCQGPVTRIGQVWADGKLIDISKYTYRFYYGTEDQLPDSLIVAKEGAAVTPAYRGLCYIVFENMDLTAFGNRLPQITVEIFRAVDDLEGRIRATTLIPAAGEFAYETQKIMRYNGPFVTAYENVNTNSGSVDIDTSLTDLRNTLPAVATVSLFVAWFGSDLRAGSCAIVPKVENSTKDTGPLEWSVNGITRSSAQVISQVSGGGPAYGGTPSDHSVTAAIHDLRNRGFQVAFTPFILMDIPAGNTLPNPYTGATGQPVYPWRGRITKQYSTADKSSGVAAEVAAFVAQYNAFVLHYASLCASAGGVQVFTIGTELRGLTWLRSAAGTYPFVSALQSLAASVKAILPGATVTYSADWSEWFGHQPADGSNDVYFHLDPLWADSHIGAIGIDNYWPLGDWRDGISHLDYAAGYREPRDPSYIAANIQGGDGYDWYYASDADRAAQHRTAITDAAYGKPWVFRFKDIKNWWLNYHINRPGGVEAGSTTPWVPQLKPVWFMEFGCPAIDRGGNQPNVFFDPKSSESARPYFSRGNRDDLMQRRYIRGVIGYFDPSAPEFVPANNPVSGIYGGYMVDPWRMFVYTWDARPYPAFPGGWQIWSDTSNWQYGHWLNGRMGGAPLSSTVAAIFNDAGFSAYDTSALTGTMQGYLVEHVASPRTLIEPLESAFFFDAIESGGVLAFRQRGLAGSLASFDRTGMVEANAGDARYEIDRAQETELPAVVKVTYTDPNKDYQQGTADARRMKGGSKYVAEAALPICMDFDQATATAVTYLHEAWSQRETLTMSLPPSQLALEAGDMVTVNAGGMTRYYRLTDVTIGTALQVSASSIEPHIYGGYDAAPTTTAYTAPAAFGAPLAAFLDLPLITGAETPYAGRVAAFASPWPGGEAFYRSATTSGYTLNVTATAQASIGVTQNAFYAGPTGRFDDGNVLQVQMYTGQLTSVDDVTLLNGANLAAVQTSAGVWEIIQFGTATLVSPGVYNLSHLLRGQYGTEGAMLNPTATGASFVILDTSIFEVSMTASDRNLAYNWKYGPAPFDVGDPAYTTAQETFTGVGLRPYAPCHITGTRDGSHNLTLAWIRRDRDPAADSWDSIEIPMSETSEAYAIDIMSGSTVKRTLTASSPTVAYTAAQQVTDFGATQASIAVRIYQISQTFGRGSPGIATV